MIGVEFNLMNTALNALYASMQRFPEPHEHSSCPANIPEEECSGCGVLISMDTKKRNSGLCTPCRKKEQDNYKFDVCG